jgi:hypothetical protein
MLYYYFLFIVILLQLLHNQYSQMLFKQLPSTGTVTNNESDYFCRADVAFICLFKCIVM